MEPCACLDEGGWGFSWFYPGPSIYQLPPVGYDKGFSPIVVKRQPVSRRCHATPILSPVDHENFPFQPQNPPSEVHPGLQATMTPAALFSLIKRDLVWQSL